MRFCFRSNSVAGAVAPAPTPNSLGAIVVAETTVLAAATLASPQEEQKREREGDGDGGTPAAASPSLDIQGACAAQRKTPFTICEYEKGPFEKRPFGWEGRGTNLATILIGLQAICCAG